MKRVGLNRRIRRLKTGIARPDGSYGSIVLAPIRYRLAAFVIDLFILTTLVACCSAIGLGAAVQNFVGVAVLMGAYSLTCWQKNQATVGKMAFSLVIVNATTLTKPSLWRWMLRFVGMCISSIGLLGYILGLMHPRNLTLHDLISGTIVIRVLHVEDD